MAFGAVKRSIRVCFSIVEHFVHKIRSYLNIFQKKNSAQFEGCFDSYVAG